MSLGGSWIFSCLDYSLWCSFFHNDFCPHLTLVLLDFLYSLISFYPPPPSWDTSRYPVRRAVCPAEAVPAAHPLSQEPSTGTDHHPQLWSGHDLEPDKRGNSPRAGFQNSRCPKSTQSQINSDSNRAWKIHGGGKGEDGFIHQFKTNLVCRVPVILVVATVYCLLQ